MWCKQHRGFSWRQEAKHTFRRDWPLGVAVWRTQTQAPAQTRKIRVQSQQCHAHTHVTSIHFLSFFEGDVWRESVLTSAARVSQILSHPFKPLLMGKYWQLMTMMKKGLTGSTGVMETV